MNKEGRLLREFSTLMIALFMFFSPVTYYSENIPDFNPECTVTSVYAKTHIVAPRDEMPAVGILSGRKEEQAHPIAPVITPTVVWSHTTSFGRAPPA